MDAFDRLMDDIRRNAEPKEKPYWMVLRDKIMKGTLNDIHTVAADVDAFFKSDAPESDKEKLAEYTECLDILLDCSKNKNEKK